MYFIRTSPEVLESRSGGGLLILFGLPFFLAGCITLAVSLGIIPADSSGGEAPSEIYFIPFSLVFLGTGLAIMFGRSGLVINRRSGTLTSWWGVFFPWRVKTIPLTCFSMVTISREKRTKGSGNNSRTITVYPVRLGGQREGEDYEIEAPECYQTARETGETLAEFLNFPLVDSSSGTAVVREPDKLNESFKARMKRLGETPERISRPPQMQSTILAMNDQFLAVELPASGLGCIHIAVITFIFLITAGIAIPILISLGNIPPIILILLAFFILSIPLSIAILMITNAFSRTRVLVSDRGIRAESRILFFRTAKEIPSEELEEFELVETARFQETSSRPAVPQADMEPKSAYQPPLFASPHNEISSPANNMSFKHPSSAGMPLTPSTGWLFQLCHQKCVMARSDRTTITFGHTLSYDELKYLYSEMKRILSR